MPASDAGLAEKQALFSHLHHKYPVKKILKAMGNAAVFAMTNHKVFLGVMFVLTAGREFPLPDWLDTAIGLVMMWTVMILWLGES